MATHLKRCPKKECHELIPVDAAACDKHLHRTCGCGCGRPVPPRFTYSPECKGRRHKEQIRTWRSKQSRGLQEAFDESKAIRETTAPVRQPPVIVVTGEEMDRRSRIEEKRLEEVRKGLNPELLAERMMRRAVVSAL